MSATIDFKNTRIAFQRLSTPLLRQSLFLFRMMGSNTLVEYGPKLVSQALRWRLPVTPLIKQTLFRQFCGGESIEECGRLANDMGRFKVQTILDYSVEGSEREEDFLRTFKELKRVIEEAAVNPHIPFAVFKMTGLARFALLEKIHDESHLSASEADEAQRLKHRVQDLCQLAHDRGVRIMIDAEETWIQDGVDHLALQMMHEFNRERAIVFTTLQMYRKDRLQYLKALHDEACEGDFHVGIKLVRGAYMEKERDRAEQNGYPSPIQDTKADTDRDYDAAVCFCLKHIDRVAFCAGTHNEESTRLVVQEMDRLQLPIDDRRIEFSQLLGMSDHLTYNLAAKGFHASKYVPYGPVRDVLPYLFRRAEENTSIAGQTGRELELLRIELRRRSAEEAAQPTEVHADS